MSEREPIGVIGTGYVGLVTAAGFAELGSDVHCIDIDAEKIAGLKRGEIPIYEPGLEELIAKNRERMHFSTDIADALDHARLLFVAVGTPPTYSGDADLSAVFSVVDSMPPSDRHALVMKSTVPVGTGRTIKRVFEETGKTGFRYVSCPEFLKEGSAVADFLNPDRVVVGDDGDWAGDAVVDLYAPLGATLVRTDIASAEMVKLASNAFLATKISFINEIANVCEETGADVLEVAKGMGLDDRIGPKFLQAGIGFGGSCFAGEETVLARRHGRARLIALEELYEELVRDAGEAEDGVADGAGTEVLAWLPGEARSRFMPLMAATRRRYEGELVSVRTKMGRRLTTTADHPWIVRDDSCEEGARVKPACELSTGDWIPLMQKREGEADSAALASLMSAVHAAQIDPAKLIVRPRPEALAELLEAPIEQRREAFALSPAGAGARTGEAKRTGTVRLSEAALGGIDVRGATISATKNGNHPHMEIELDERFWRVVGLYLAEGCLTADGGRLRTMWSFRLGREQHLVDEVVGYWASQGVRARAALAPTSHRVTVDSRLLGTWWTQVLGLGRNSYEQRLPDMIWDRPEADKWALLSGLWEGDGSWSLVNGGPSVILEFGTVSRELADGVLRLLGDLGIVASQRVGRTAKSTADTYWLRISGADQVERAIALVPERDRAGVLASIARQSKRAAPAGYVRDESGTVWVRAVEAERRPFAGDVYSLELVGVHSVAATGGLAVHNCFPKDVNALKQLAGNSGYHFQLLGAVIEVNELQKRRVIGKLQKHLGSLVGKRIALLGLAFKPNTDDMREASSLVLSARLQADGALVSAYDPIAEEEAKKLIRGVEFADDAMDAIQGADAVVLVTEWSEFGSLDWSAIREAMRGDVVIDGRNYLDPATVRAAGLRYEGIGRA